MLNPTCRRSLKVYVFCNVQYRVFTDLQLCFWTGAARRGIAAGCVRVKQAILSHDSPDDFPGRTPPQTLTFNYETIHPCRSGDGMGQCQRRAAADFGGIRGGYRVGALAPEGQCAAGRLGRLHHLDVERTDRSLHAGTTPAHNHVCSLCTILQLAFRWRLALAGQISGVSHMVPMEVCSHVTLIKVRVFMPNSEQFYDCDTVEFQKYRNSLWGWQWNTARV